MLIGSLLFVLGFSFVFVSFGALIGGVGDWLFDLPAADHDRARRPDDRARPGLPRASVPWMQRDFRIHQVPAVGLAAAPLLGVLFGLGWTPCIGPTLSAVLSLSVQRGAPPAAGRC